MAERHGRWVSAYMVCKCFPELAVDERYDAAGVFWCATVILAMSILASLILVKYLVLIDKTDLAYSPPLLSAFCPSAHVFHVVWLIPARSDERSSRYNLGPEDLVETCVSYYYPYSSVAASIDHQLP